MGKQVLGRGLGALLGGTGQDKDATQPQQTAQQPPAQSVVQKPEQKGYLPHTKPEKAIKSEEVLRVPIHKLKPSSLQPRKDFSNEAITELAESIKQKGILQPLIVRPVADHYEIIAGERRYRAAQLAGLTEAPVVIKEVDDRAALEMSLIENLQRENLNPIEEAEGYANLINTFNLTQEEAAAKVGKNRATVANALRLLKLPDEIKSLIRSGNLSTGHAKAILAIESPTLQKLAAEKVIKNSLNVRQTEELVDYLKSHSASAPNTKTKKFQPRDAHIVDLEKKLMQKFGTKVTLHYRDGKGAVEIKYFSNDELERILSIVGIELD
ncbi:MAG: ParB/RepB/Spo0J family partition protein [Verrucomicrobiia bacterium]|jgi:ParB family chromosome partitioning protein